MTRALLIVDLQVDFVEGGALAVSGGNAVAHGVADMLTEAPDRYAAVFASQDWHNPLPDLNGGHFAPEGTNPDYVTTWPVHCVSGTWGAVLHPVLHPALSVVELTGRPVVRVHKGQGRPDYSAFQGISGDLATGRTLGQMLWNQEITELDIVGIATDHCVYRSAADALDLVNVSGVLSEVRVLTDLCAGVDLRASQDALSDLEDRGARLVSGAAV